MCPLLPDLDDALHEVLLRDVVLAAHDLLHHARLHHLLPDGENNNEMCLTFKLLFGIRISNIRHEYERGCLYHYCIIFEE